MNPNKLRDPFEEADRLVAEAFANAAAAEDAAWDRYTAALEMAREVVLDDDMPDAEDGVGEYRNRRGE